MTRYLKEYTDLNRSVGRLIRNLRKSRGISQMKLAEEIGVSYQQVQKYEYGSTQLSVSRLNQIADVLGVSLNTFIAGSPTTGNDLLAWLSPKEREVLKLISRVRTSRERGLIMDIFEKFLILMLDGKGTGDEIPDYEETEEDTEVTAALENYASSPAG